MSRRVGTPIRKLCQIAVVLILSIVTVLAWTQSVLAQSATDVRVRVIQGTGSGTYKKGVKIPIAANVPPARFTFNRWIIIGGRVADPTAQSSEITPSPSSRYVLAYASWKVAPAGPTKHLLTVHNGTGSGKYLKDTTVPIVANQPPAGRVFVRWTDPFKVVADQNSKSTTLKMPPHRAYVTPYFGVDPALITVAVMVRGGTPAGTTKQHPGDKVAVSANPAAPGKVFDKWVGTTAGLADKTSADTVLTVPKTPVMLVATYKTTTAKMVAVSVTGGTPAGTTQHAAGAKIAVMANQAAAGKEFDQWTGTTAGLADKTSAATVLTVPTTPVLLTATYRTATAKMVAVSVTGGTPAGTTQHAVGAKVAIKADAPSAGKVFDQWTGDPNALQNRLLPETILTVPANVNSVSVAASYKAAPPKTVAITVSGGSTSGSYEAGSKLTISANVPPAGQVFDKWTGPATVVFENALLATTTITVPSAPATVVANFKPAGASNVVSLTSHVNGSVVSVLGATVFGTVKAPTTVETLVATLSTTNRKTALDVDRVSGRFALRLFEGDVALGASLALSFERKDMSGAIETGLVTLTGANEPGNLAQIAGRLTFGTTPALLNQIKTTGFNAWVNQQLNPASINDASLVAMNPEGLLRITDEPWQLRESIPWWQSAYAAYSQRQLLEVMTNFWNNHFWSIDTDSNFHLADVEEIKGFRANALGKFRELLRVSTKNPQMMRFLDNVDSKKGRLNENYAREVLELHTVGVNGGYGNDDVVAVARILTGWGAEVTSAKDAKPIVTRFKFRDGDHDTGDKIVPFLNQTIKGRTGVAGEQEGEELLDILARHPKTQEFVCGKLVELLVSDARPANFVDVCTAEWQRTDGNMKDILSKMLLAPEYTSNVDFQRTKAKTPFEYLVGFVRNFGVYPVQGKERDFFNTFRNSMRDAGQDLIGFGVPTGFKETGKAWTNTASMMQKFKGATNQVIWYTTAGAGANRHSTVNYAQLVKDAGMNTAQAAAAYLLALSTADRFRQDEFDAVVAALNGTQGFDPAKRDEGPALRRAVGLIVTLPSYQLQ